MDSGQMFIKNFNNQCSRGRRALRPLQLHVGLLKPVEEMVPGYDTNMYSKEDVEY